MKNRNYLFVLLLLPLFGMAQSILVKNGRIVDASGAVVSGNVLVEDGVVKAVGEIDQQLLNSVEEVDAQGRFVTAGLIDSSTKISVAEVESSVIGLDIKTSGINLGAGFHISHALNRHSSMIPIALNDGITRGVVTPLPGVNHFAGVSAVVQFGGGRKFATKEEAAVHLYLREQDRKLAGGSRSSALSEAIRELHEAERYSNNTRAYQSGKTRDFSQSENDLKVLARVLKQELPVVIHINRASDIEIVLERLESFNLRIVLSGVTEGWKVGSLLAEKGIPVLLNVLDNRPSSFDKMGARLDNASLLVEAGVTVAFMSEDPFSEFRSIAHAAGVAVAYGLEWSEAIKAITINPATIWGLSNHGHLKEGAVADLVIWDGDPLEVMSAPVKVMVDGKWTDLTTRQQLLRDRYRDLGNQDIPYGYR